jgi:hypothetical protein
MGIFFCLRRHSHPLHALWRLPPAPGAQTLFERSACLFHDQPQHQSRQGASKKKPKNKEESVGCFKHCFCVGLRFFGLFCKNLLHVILTPPARYQHPHDANNPQVGHGAIMSPNGGLKAAPPRRSPPPQKQNSEHTRGELNGLVVYGDVRIGLTFYSSSCSTRYELNLLHEKEKKMSVGKKKTSAKNKCFVKTPHKGVIRGN